MLTSGKKEQIIVKKDHSEWKEDMILADISNPKRSNSKYSVALNSSYHTAVGGAYMSRERPNSQNSFSGISSNTLGERPSSSFNYYGGDLGDTQKGKPSMYSTVSKLKSRSNSIQAKGNSTSFDRVRNYKSRMFKDSMPVYGAFDAFNRQILKHSHEESGSSNPRGPRLALRPTSKLSDKQDVCNKTFYPSLMKKPRERVKEEVKNLIVFRRTFHKSPQKA